MAADRSPIDFGALAAELLRSAETWCSRWLPGGHREGHEWQEASTREGGLGDSLKVNLNTGAWAHFASDERGGDLISLYAYLHNVDNGTAARTLMRELGWVRDAGDEPVPARRVQAPAQPAPEEETGGPSAPTSKREPKWRALVPVPAHAPKPGFTFGFRDAKRGNAWTELEPTRTWEYRFEGELYGYVARFERVASDGEIVKDTIARTWCINEADGRGLSRWHWKSWESPRPLYVPATLLSHDLSLPVVIVEGEKCAEAAHALLGHEFDFVSWPGGAKAWAKAGWGWLMGRTVYLWPDADAQRERLSRVEREAGVSAESKPLLPEHKQPGMAAMVGIGSLLVADHGCTVLMCQVPKPGAVASGWDVADAIAQGWDAARVRDFIRSAVPFRPPDDAARAKAGISTPSIAGAVQGEEESKDWRGYLLTSATTGAIKTVRENVVLALDGWPEKGVPGIVECAGLIRFNEFTNNVEKVRSTPWGTPAGDWLEADELMMADWLVREHWMPSMSRQALEEAVIVVSRRHSYHPLRKRMQALRGKWDGEKRLDQWLRRVFLVEDEYDVDDDLQRYLTLAGRFFIMGMVARVLDARRLGGKLAVGPGCKFDYMLVLEGPTGWGKSTFAKLLGGDHFADTGLDVTQKDSLMNIQGIWVYEWSELDQLAKQEIGAIKRFISSPEDRFRATFDRRPAKYPRQVVFLGTTEEANYLLDHKGNRRFWPVRLTQPPDDRWFAENMEQLLAEAVHRVDALERFWPTREEQRELFDPQQQARQVESSLEGAIRSYLYDEDQKISVQRENGTLVNQISMQDLLTRVGFTIDKQTDAVVKKAGSVLHMLGWEVRRTSQAGRPRVYVRPGKQVPPLPPRAASGSDGSAQHDAAARPGGADEYPF